MSPAKPGPFRRWLSRVLLGWTVDDLRAEAHDAFADESHNHDEGHEHGGEGWFDDAFRDFERATDHESTHDEHDRLHRDLEDLPDDVEELDDQFRELERRVVLLEQAGRAEGILVGAALATGADEHPAPAAMFHFIRRPGIGDGCGERFCEKCYWVASQEGLVEIRKHLPVPDMTQFEGRLVRVIVEAFG